MGESSLLSPSPVYRARGSTRDYYYYYQVVYCDVWSALSRLSYDPTPEGVLARARSVSLTDTSVAEGLVSGGHNTTELQARSKL